MIASSLPVALPVEAELFHLLVEGIVDYAIFFVSPEGLVRTWNAGAERLKGWKAAEIVGRPLATFYAPEDRDIGALLLDEARQNGRAEAEGWRLRKDGSRFWANVVLTALRNEAGQLRGFAKITRDLTERRETELGLRAALERQRMLLDSTMDENVSLDVEGRITAFNRAFALLSEELTGRRAEIGQLFEEGLAPASLPLWRERRSRVLRGESIEYEATIQRRGVTERRLVMRSPIVAHDEILGEMISARDITRLHQAGQQRAVLSEVLRLADRSTSQIDDLYREAVMRCCVYLGWTCGHVLRPRGEDGALVSAKLWYLADGSDAHEAFRRVSERVSFRAGEGLPGSALAAKDVVFFPDVAVAPNFPRRALLGDVGFHAALAVPVIVDEEVVAVLELFSTRFVEEPGSLLELGRLVGAQLARAVERERAASALGFAERRFFELFESAPAGMALADESGRIVAANAALAKLAGVTPAELRLRAVQDLFDRESSPDLAAATRREEVGRLVHRSGEIFDVDVRIAELPAGPEIGRGLVVHVTDRTTRNRLQRERELLEERQRRQAFLMNSILEQIDAAVLVADAGGRIALQNPAARRQFGAVGTLAEVAARLRDDAGGPLGEAESPLARVLAGAATAGATVAVRGEADEGPSACVELEVRALSDATLGGASQVLVVAHDVSALKRREHELERSNAELEQFAYAASHDLRAPLRAVRSLASMLREDLAGTLSADSAAHFELLENRVGRMEGLLAALLEYARAGRGNDPAVAFELHRVVDETIGLASVREGIRVVNECPGAILRSSRVALERVLLNLVVNAAKHHDRPTGTITVRARDEGARLVFDVVDDGPGIPAAYHERVFKMFQTLRSRDEVEGSGMGLTLVKKLVEQVGGTIALVSEGRGCQFTFTWPKAWPGEDRGER